MTVEADELRGRPAGRRKIRWSRVLLYATLVSAAALYLLPVYMLIITGLKSFQEVSLARMWDLPSGLHLDSFVQAWFGDPARGIRGLNSNFINSLLIAIPATIGSAFLGSLNGYVLSKWKFPGSNLIFTLMLFGMFIPYQSILIPHGEGATSHGPLRLDPRADLRPHRLRHPDLHADLPKLLCGGPERAAGGGQDRRRRSARHLPLHPLPDLDPRPSSW